MPGPATRPVSAAHCALQPEQNPEGKRAAIRRLFTRAKAATRRAEPDPPKTKKRRSRGEDSGRAAFFLAAQRLLRSAARLSRSAFARTGRGLVRPAADSRQRQSIAAAAFLADTLDSLAGASFDNGPFDPMIDPCRDFGDDSGASEDPDMGAAVDSDGFGPTETNHLSPNL